MSEINEAPDQGSEDLSNQFYDHVAEAEQARKSRQAQTEKPVEESKPWEAKHKDKEQTPGWARKRFNEYSGTVRTLKEENAQLQKNVQDLLKQFKPQEKELVAEDFATPADFVKHTAQEAAKQVTAQAMSQAQKIADSQREIDNLNLSHERNVQAALTDIPDYHEAMQNGDPTVTLPGSVLKHLKVSPAGPYVEYRIATDEELSEQIKACTTQQEKWNLIQGIHDEILNSLIARQPVDQIAQSTSQAPERKQGAQVATVAKRVAPPSAPPKSRGMVTSGDMHSMSTDDYIKARNEEKRSRTQR